MGEQRRRKAIERGNALVTPFGFELAEVAGLELEVSKFRNVATAKQWARNHGFDVERVVSKTRSIDVACRSETDFEPGTLRLEKLSRSVSVWVGVLKAHLIPEIEEEPEVVFETPEVAEIEKRLVRLRGDVFVIEKQEDDPEDSVRTIGIVAKPEDPDAEGTVISEEEIERANLGFMRDFGTVGLMHATDVSDKVSIIQNVIAPITFTWPGTDREIRKGTWYQEHYTEDPDLVQRIRGGSITGLSLGGLAQVEEFDEPVEMSVSKSLKSERVEKGDVATNRFHNLRVEEVSLVDAAANEEDFLVIKRRKEMPNGKDAAVKKSEETANEDAPIETPVERNEETTEEETPTTATLETTDASSIADQVAAGVTAGMSAFFSENPGVPGVETRAVSTESEEDETPETESTPVEKSEKSEILEAIAGINRRLDEQDAKIEKATTVRAAAKGTSVPDSTTVAEKAVGDEKPKSKWAGTAVHRVAQRGQKK